MMRNAVLEESKAGIKIIRRNINKLRYVNDTTLMAESEEELKNLLMRVKEESEKAGLKLNIRKMKIMASGSFTSWQINGKSSSSDRLNFLGLQNHCSDGSHESKMFAPWKENCNKPRQHIKKQRHHFAGKGPYSQD